MTYKTIVKVWSDVGHTPITNRGSSYQDELVHTEIECTDPTDAFNKTLEIKRQTPHAYQCYFYMPDYPNQNTRSRFCHSGRM